MPYKRRQLSVREKVFIVKNYYWNQANIPSVQDEFQRTFSVKTNDGLLKTINKLVNSFERTGSLLSNFSVECENEVPADEDDKPLVTSRGRRRKKREEILDEVEVDNNGEDDNSGVSVFLPDGSATGSCNSDMILGDESNIQPEIDTLEESVVDAREEADEQATPAKRPKLEVLTDEDDEEEAGEKNADTGSDEEFGAQSKKKRKPSAAGKSTIKQKTECGVCGKWYTPEYFRSHMRKHDREGVTYTCDTCGLVFEKYVGLKMHEETHIPESEYQFCCDACPQRFVSQYKLDFHKKSHVEPKSFICEWCGMIFAKPDSLKVHTRTHTGEKPLKCKECGASFAFYASLKAHQKIHSEGQFKCDYCDLTFIYAVARNVSRVLLHCV